MFNLRRINNGRQNVAEPEFMPTDLTDIKVGQALTMTAGKLTATTGANKPTFIATGIKDTNTGLVPVMRVKNDMEFDVPVTFSSTPVALVLGSKVTLDTEGMGVTDVTTSGVATIIDTLNATKVNGDIIRIIFE